MAKKQRARTRRSMSKQPASSRDAALPMDELDRVVGGGGGVPGIGFAQAQGFGPVSAGGVPGTSMGPVSAGGVPGTSMGPVSAGGVPGFSFGK